MWLAQADLQGIAAIVAAAGFPTAAGLFLKWLTARRIERDTEVKQLRKELAEVRKENSGLWEANNDLWKKMTTLEQRLHSLEGAGGSRSRR